MGGIAFAAVRLALGLPAIWLTSKAEERAGLTRKKTPDYFVGIVIETNISTEGNQHEYPKSIKPR
jgi:hypothetical protein